MHGDREPLGALATNASVTLAPFLDREQHALAGGAAREHAVDAAVGQEPGECRDRVGVDRAASVAHRGHARGDGALQAGHDRERDGASVVMRLRSASSVFSTGFSAMRRMNHGYHDGP